MQAKRSPILGYNHNVQYRGLVFHIQTEDSGLKAPHVFTHLFYGGVIISTRKLVYDAGTAEDGIKALMQSQHKAVMKDLRRGTFDEKIDVYLAGTPGLLPASAGKPVIESGPVATAAMLDADVAMTPTAAGSLTDFASPSSASAVMAAVSNAVVAGEAESQPVILPAPIGTPLPLSHDMAAAENALATAPGRMQATASAAAAQALVADLGALSLSNIAEPGLELAPLAAPPEPSAAPPPTAIPRASTLVPSAASSAMARKSSVFPIPNIPPRSATEDSGRAQRLGTEAEVERPPQLGSSPRVKAPAGIEALAQANLQPANPATPTSPTLTANPAAASDTALSRAERIARAQTVVPDDDLGLVPPGTVAPVPGPAPRPPVLPNEAAAFGAQRVVAKSADPRATIMGSGPVGQAQRSRHPSEAPLTAEPRVSTEDITDSLAYVEISHGTSQQHKQTAPSTTPPPMPPPRAGAVMEAAPQEIDGSHTAPISSRPGQYSQVRKRGPSQAMPIAEARRSLTGLDPATTVPPPVGNRARSASIAGAPVSVPPPHSTSQPGLSERRTQMMGSVMPPPDDELQPSFGQNQSGWHPSHSAPYHAAQSPSAATRASAVAAQASHRAESMSAAHVPMQAQALGAPRPASVPADHQGFGQPPQPVTQQQTALSPADGPRRTRPPTQTPPRPGTSGPNTTASGIRRRASTAGAGVVMSKPAIVVGGPNRSGPAYQTQVRVRTAVPDRTGPNPTISEKSLDEVILAYLSEDSKNR